LRDQKSGNTNRGLGRLRKTLQYLSKILEVSLVSKPKRVRMHAAPLDPDPHIPTFVTSIAATGNPQNVLQHPDDSHFVEIRTLHVELVLPARARMPWLRSLLPSFNEERGTLLPGTS
jgi:hypothetical protein